MLSALSWQLQERPALKALAKDVAIITDICRTQGHITARQAAAAAAVRGRSAEAAAGAHKLQQTKPGALLLYGHQYRLLR
jgi:hypothetical protein